jgi:hypothetical protein
MGDESNELSQQLNSNLLETGWAVGEEEPGYFDDMNWEPTPVDAAPGNSFVLSMLTKTIAKQPRGILYPC